jgi:hypothetical protein
MFQSWIDADQNKWIYTLKVVSGYGPKWVNLQKAKMSYISERREYMSIKEQASLAN